MLDIQSILSKLKRPKLLVRAARFGLDDYRREVDLLRTLDTHILPRPGDALMQLVGLEEDYNLRRINKDATYSIARHIDALTAIMCEARTLQATTSPVVTPLQK